MPVTDIAIVLASASPQRSLLLSELGVAFVVAPSSVDEDAHPELIPAKRAAILAEEKARDVAPRHPGSWVIGCDTLVEAADGALLEKAKDAAEARAMLDRMSGKTCLVHSGLFVLDPAGVGAGGLSSNAVTFKQLSESEKDWWIASGHWKGRSGAFQIDGPGQMMISRLEGDWTAVVGLPVYLLGQLFEERGVSLTTLTRTRA